jgi:hypothetical protein
MKINIVKKTIKVACFAAVCFLAPKIRADEVNDLIGTILQASPNERAKVETYKKSLPKKTNQASSKKAIKDKDPTIVPDLGIPENQLLESSAKFPKDIKGLYIYGTVTFKAINNFEGEPCIQFCSKNGRIFLLYTTDSDVLSAFSGYFWGTKFTIPKECPLRLLARDLLPGSYVVRLPYDMSNKDYTIGELNRDFGDSMKKDFQDRGGKIKQDFENTGRAFQGNAYPVKE